MCTWVAVKSRQKQLLNHLSLWSFLRTEVDFPALAWALGFFCRTDDWRMTGFLSIFWDERGGGNIKSNFDLMAENSLTLSGWVRVRTFYSFFNTESDSANRVAANQAGSNTRGLTLWGVDITVIMRLCTQFYQSLFSLFYVFLKLSAFWAHDLYRPVVPQ